MIETRKDTRPKVLKLNKGTEGKELFHKLKCYVVNIYGGGSQIASIVTFIPKIRNKNYLN